MLQGCNQFVTFSLWVYPAAFRVRRTPHKAVCVNNPNSRLSHADDNANELARYCDAGGDAREPESSLTLRWRELDSNHRFLMEAGPNASGTLSGSLRPLDLKPLRISSRRSGSKPIRSRLKPLNLRSPSSLRSRSGSQLPRAASSLSARRYACFSSSLQPRATITGMDLSPSRPAAATLP